MDLRSKVESWRLWLEGIQAGVPAASRGGFRDQKGREKRPDFRSRGCRPFDGEMILPANDGHPVKRVHYATEVNHDKTKSSKEDEQEAVFKGV